MNPKLKKYVRTIIAIYVLIGIVIGFGLTIVIVDWFGSNEALATEDNTKEIMASCIADASELWTAERERIKTADDGDKIAISVIAAKLFEARYLQTYIK